MPTNELSLHDLIRAGIIIAIPVFALIFIIITIVTTSVVIYQKGLY